jgi:hypothetical protein
MKILVSYRGIPHAPGFEIGASIARGFRQLGHEVYPYGNVYQSRNMIPGAIFKSQLQAAAWKPDLLAWVECNDADPQYAELFSLDCPKVQLDFDTAMNLAKTAQIVAGLKPDLLCLGNAEFIQYPFPGAKKIKHLPFGADPYLFRPGTGPRSGAGMIGTSFPARDAFCKRAGLELNQAYGPDYVKVLQRLRLHLHHTTTAGDGLLVTRNFETLASGCVLLTKDTPEVRKYFEPNKHLFLYRDDDEAIALIRALMSPANDGMVAQVAQAGMEEALARHTYRHRCQSILDYL